MKSDDLIKSILAKIEVANMDVHVKIEKEQNLLGDGAETGAIFSTEDPAVYRYFLWRMWDPNLPCLILIMLNPSEADQISNDQTITVVLSRAKEEGFGAIAVINLFAWRSKSPANMKKAESPVGPLNDQITSMLLSDKNQAILCAWGPHGTHRNRNEEVKCQIQRAGIVPLVINLSKNGEPGHPLYKQYAEKLRPWPGFMQTN